MRHPSELFDKMYEYKMDPPIIVENAELTRFHPQRDGRTNVQEQSYDCPVVTDLTLKHKNII